MSFYGLQITAASFEINIGNPTFDLVELKNGDILVLFEAGKENPYDGIYYIIISKTAL